MKQVPISLDSNVAAAFLNAGQRERNKAEYLINIWLKNIFFSKTRARQELFDAMEKAGKIAQSKGLTPEILQQILDEKE